MNDADGIWQTYAAQTLVVLALILAFQYVLRGELNVLVAIIAAAGYFAISVAIDRYRSD